MTNYSIQQLLHSKTFVRFLLSFLAIVLVVMIPFTIIQRQDLIKNRERELTLSSNNSLDLTVNYVDSLLFVTDNILNSVSMNSTLSTYRIQPDDMNRLASIRALSQFRNLNRLIVNLFYIPARDNGYYLSWQSSYTRKTFYDIFQRRFLTPEQFLQYAKQPFLTMTSFSDTITDTIQNKGSTTPVISLLYSMPYGGAGKYALLLFDIDQDKMRADLRLNLPDGQFYLMNSEAEMLLSSDGAAADTDDLLSLVSGSAIQDMSVVSLDGVRCYSFARNLAHNWRLYYFVPVQTLTKMITRQQVQSILQLLLILTIGVAISLVLSIWNYHPVISLKRVFSSNGTANEKTFSDDFKRIENGISQIYASNTQLQSRLERNRQAIVSHHVFNLINNRLTPEDIPKIEADGVCFHHANYGVAIFVPQHSAIISREGGWLSEIYHTAPAGWDVYLMEYKPSKMYIGILSLPEMPDDALYTILKDAQDALPAPVTISFAKASDDIFSLSSAFLKAQSSLQQRFFQSEQSIFISAVERQESRSFIYPHAQLATLNVALENMDAFACRQVIDELFSDIKNNATSLETVCCICFEIVNQIIRQHEKSHVPIDQIEALLPDIFQLSYEDTLEDMEDLMRNAVENTIENCCGNHQGPVSDSPSIQSLLSYIDQNCYRSDFSVQMVAEEFHLTNSGMNKFMREATGMTMNKYIQSKRIGMARQLLVTTDFSLTEIVEQIGYIDLSSFIKLFRQETGMTPMSYRKLYQ